MEFSNLKDLEKYINNQIQQSLESDVGHKLVEIAQQHVQSDVYDVYKDPKVYQRTGQLKDSFEVTPIANGIEIENTRHDGDRYIPEIIEYGHDKSEQGYQYPAYYADRDNFIQPRPFMSNAESQIEKENIHVNELKKSLKTKGFTIE